MRRGTLCSGLVVAWGGMYRLKFISHLVVDALWASLKSLPPKLAIVALVVTDIVRGHGGKLQCVEGWIGEHRESSRYRRERMMKAKVFTV